jgi:hypothetical protein
MRPQKAIVPGIILGSLILILLTKLLTSTQVAAAATQQPGEAIVASDSNSCSLTSLPNSISQWCRLIDQASQQYGVPSQLVAAVMLQESGGQSDVISASGAVGLMQVMPSDGIAASFQCANGPCFASRPSTDELLDPAFNIDYGVRMLAGLINRYGNERDALKAYGPYNVEYYYADKVLTIKGNL